MGEGYQPIHKAQLDGSATESYDCGVIACAVGIDMATRGVKQPKRDHIRNRMDVPSGGTNMWDIERAIKSYDTPDELEGVYTTLKCRRETDGGGDGTWDTVKASLQEKRGVVLGVDYGMLRRSAPNLTGSESFDGWHSILLSAWDKRDGEWKVRVYDSLNDGRYSGCPKGPVWIAAPKVRDAAYAYGKAVHGKAERIAGVFLLTSPKVEPDEPDPEPEPPDPCAAVAIAAAEAGAAILGYAEDHPEAAAQLAEVAETIRLAVVDPAADADAEPEDGLTT
jgi:hypothetical protein